MDFSKHTTTDIATFTNLFSVDPAQGLTRLQVAEQHKKYGINKLSESKVSALKIFLRQFNSSFIYLLIAATILSFFLGEIIEGWMIVAFLFINTTLGFYQEYRSEQTVELLKKYVTKHVTVKRDGVTATIPAQELVPGDVVILDAGDSIPADMRIVETFNLLISEEPLTGESLPIKKEAEALTQPANEPYEATNICFSGTSVISGSGTGVVFAISSQTMLGDIARITGGMTRESKFEQELNKFSKFILYLVIGTLLFIFAANIALKGWRADIASLAIFSIALAVSVVPEALPVVMTFSLSRGARRLAENKVIVKRLSAIEDLGSIQVLCSDKTGTLTENKLTVKNTWSTTQTISTKEILTAASMGGSYLFTSEQGKTPDPFDTALWSAISEEDQAAIKNKHRIHDIPFDPVHKKNSVIVEEGGRTILYVRGAPESIVNGSLVDPADRESMMEWMAEEGRAGRRTLAIASKELFSPYQSIDSDSGLSFIGCISFVDPVKATAHQAIKEARALNVAIKIITGDSKEVAGQVAFEVGLAEKPTDVLSAHEFFALSDQDREETLERINVFARVSPEEKYKIIELLQKKYQVGFLGEGINDAPALKIANVAIVVDSASDIAREAADIILLERSLGAVVCGIREGRMIFANTIKYIRSSLSSNFGNFYSVAVSSLFISFLPMLPLQILLVNLLSDFPAIAIASDNVDLEELQEPKQYNVRKIIMFGTVLGIVSTIFDFIIFAAFYKVSPESLQTHWFIESILTELVFLYSIRSRAWFFSTVRPSVPLLLLSLSAFIATIALPFTSVGHELFHFMQPSLGSLGFVLSLVVAYFITTEFAKVAYYRLTTPPPALVH